jgi:ribosomal protein S12 methylthiotransferase accessory factor YcaO
VERKIKTLHPADLILEVNYNDEPLHWLEGTTLGENGIEPAMVPIQALFLFCNLDETSLFSGLGSTGLASGNTMEQAKLSALLEIVERHQEATVPFTPETCFDLIPGSCPIAPLFDGYRAMGVHLQFQDLTPKYGIPCCKCFVRAKDGTIHKGTAAHLNARQAIVSAMTETTYPFPSGPPSAGGLANLIGVGYDNLPDYSTACSTDGHAQDLDLVERLLIANGRRPFYVDLTRRDINLPVVKALVPGMDILGDFDRFSRVHPELFQNYLERR